MARLCSTLYYYTKQFSDNVEVDVLLINLLFHLPPMFATTSLPTILDIIHKIC